MDSYQNTSNAQRTEGNPAFSAGLEAGLLGSVLILIEQMLQNFIELPVLSLILGLIRVCIWLGVGALAVYWLRARGSVIRSDQTKAGIIAGLVTGLVTGVLLVVFGFIQSKTIEDLPLPVGISLETFDQIFGVTLICCFGIPSLIIAAAFSLGGSLLMGLFIRPPTQVSLEQQVPFQAFSQTPTAQHAIPVQETPPQKLVEFLSREGLPLELHPYVAAYQRGEIVEARTAFVRFLRENPKHAHAWLWLAVMLDDPERRLECVTRALAYEPNNQTAHSMLAFLKRPPTA